MKWNFFTKWFKNEEPKNVKQVELLEKELPEVIDNGVAPAVTEQPKKEFKPKNNGYKRRTRKKVSVQN